MTDEGGPPEWKSLAPMSTQRGNAGGVFVNNHQFLVIGGRQGTTERLASCEYYDTRTEIWKNLDMFILKESASKAFVSINPDMFNESAFWGVVCASNKVFAMGERHLLSMDLFGSDLSIQRAWKWERLAFTNKIRRQFAQQFIYLFGGQDANYNKLSTAERYNIKTNEWEMLSEEMPGGARDGCAAGVVGDRIFVVGGSDKDGNELATTIVFDTKNQQWESKTYPGAKPAVPNMRTKRSGLSVVVVEHFVIAIGGSMSTKTIEVLDTQRNAWDLSPTTMEYPLEHFVAGFCKETNEIIVAGGKSETDLYKDSAWSIPFEDRILPFAFLKKYSVGQSLNSDSDKGEDLLFIDTIALVFAQHLASRNLEPPFTLAIIGEWGSGKSFFFNRIKQHLINIQKSEEESYTSHLYCIKFNSWTYSKKDLWASLMFCIFQELSYQLEMEKYLKEFRGEKKPSIIEMCDGLSKAERSYLDLLYKQGIPVDTLLEKKRNIDTVSESFSEIFLNQQREDKEELQRAVRDLNNLVNTNVWKRTQNDGKITNAFKRAVIAQMNQFKNSNEVKYKEMLRKDLQENFQELNICIRCIAYVRETPPVVLAILALVLVFSFLFATLYEKFIANEEEEDAGYIAGFISLFLAIIGSIIETFRQWCKPLEKFSEDFSIEISEAIKIVSDIQAEATSLISNDLNLDIKKNVNEIDNIKRRLTVLAGESMQKVVSDRINKNVYLQELGIVHQAHEDLHSLSEAMYNKYKREHENVEFRLRFKNAEDAPSHKGTVLLLPNDNSKVPVLNWMNPNDGEEFTFWFFLDENSNKENVICVMRGKKGGEYENKDIKEMHIEINKSVKGCTIAVDHGKKEVIFHSVENERNEIGTRSFEVFKKSSSWEDVVNGVSSLKCFDNVFSYCSGNKEHSDNGNTNPNQGAPHSNKEMFPRGPPRIILFIDDLDRCDPEKVIEVLEAMQLLVKEKIFVVVVAIDSRYVCLSLQNKKYKEILHRNRSPTPMDFLAKIIQVPFRLPAMSDDAIDRYVEAQANDYLDIQRDVHTEPAEDATVNEAAKNTAETTAKNSAEKPAKKSTQKAAKRDAAEANAKDSFERATAAAAAAAAAAANPPALYMNKDDMKRNLGDTSKVFKVEPSIDRKELKDLQDACKAFKLVPRTVKYLVNSRKLIKNILKKDEKRKQAFSNKGIGRVSVFLLAMASSKQTRDGIHKLFAMMDEKEKPNISDNNNFRDIICYLCKGGLKPHQEKLIRDEFNYDISTERQWIDLCNQLELARCFSFMHILEGSEDKND